MFYNDLSQYEYSRWLDRDGGRLYNFGWLSSEHSYERGASELDWFRKLELAVANFVNPYRGVHSCDFCGAVDQFVEIGGKRILLGHAEAWVPSSDGRIFVAPTLVHHYVTAHDYRPPDVVIAALRALPDDVAQWDTPDGLYRTLLAEIS